MSGRRVASRVAWSESAPIACIHEGRAESFAAKVSRSFLSLYLCGGGRPVSMIGPWSIEGLGSRTGGAQAEATWTPVFRPGGRRIASSGEPAPTPFHDLHIAANECRHGGRR